MIIVIQLIYRLSINPLQGINFILGSVLSRSRDRGLRDTDRAREHFTVAALAGDVGAMAQLGQMYAGVARTRGEWEEASKWLRLAAEGKDAAGLFGVGAMLLRRVGEESGRERAVWGGGHAAQASGVHAYVSERGGADGVLDDERGGEDQPKRS